MKRTIQLCIVFVFAIGTSLALNAGLSSGIAMDDSPDARATTTQKKRI